MFHYFIKVPPVGEIITTKETVISRLEYYNDRHNYLLFESGDETENRFILVCKKKVNKTILGELKDVFETSLQFEEINVSTIGPTMLQKIQIAKKLMVDDDFCGDRTTLLVTDNISQLLEEADAMIGFAKYKEFLKYYTDYIDRTAEIKAKSLYNVVLINKCGVCLDSHIKLLYGILAAKGLLMEHVLIKGDLDDVIRTKKETKFVYVIEDEWKTDDGGEYFRASDEVKLLNKIAHSNNIYITSMNQEEYNKISILDSFVAAFPHVVIIDELSLEEKIEYISSIATEYGFTVNKEELNGSKLINTSTIDKIEIAVRKAVQKKLVAKDNSFCIGLSDFDLKVKKIKIIAAFDELESLIGLDSVKKTIKEIVTFLKKRGKNAVPCLHMAFLGNPGTGKTTVARILARIFAETGITKKNLLVETDRRGLIGLYVGHTADKTARKIDSALGGVLFIDEAYSLYAGDKIDYGNEAVATLVKAMEDKRDEFVCILAGYTKEMNEMLNMNPGLRDRVQFYIDFPDYSELELMKIFEKLCKENKYRLSESARTALKTGFSRIISTKTQNFSNGRLVRKIFERVRIKQALRASNNTITDLDIEEVFSEKDIAALSGRDSHTMIGFRN